jgi:hypothetical protein
MVVNRTALGGYWAFEEGGQEGIEWVHSLDLTASQDRWCFAPAKGRGAVRRESWLLEKVGDVSSISDLT